MRILNYYGVSFLSSFFYYNFGGAIISKQEVLINNQIRAKEIRVIDVDGTQLGVMGVKDAIEIAESKGVDLIEISPNAEPPVCKIMDYGKYKFELAKKEKEAKKKQKTVTTKEIRMSVNIDKHDIEIKAKKAVEFIEDKNKVKVAVVFQGREMAYMDLGKNVLDQFIEAVGDIAVVDKPAMQEGRSMMMILAPKK